VKLTHGQLETFAHQHLGDPTLILEVASQILYDMLPSADPPTIKMIEDKIMRYADYIEGPGKPCPPYINSALMEELIDEGHTLDSAFPIACDWWARQRGGWRTGKRRGAPSPHGPQALQAFTLRRRTRRPWYSIAAEVYGQCGDFCVTCRDVARRPGEHRCFAKTSKRTLCSTCSFPLRREEEKEIVCEWCVGALRHGVEELEKLLKDDDLLPYVIDINLIYGFCVQFLGLILRRRAWHIFYSSYIDRCGGNDAQETNIVDALRPAARDFTQY
jgi:hypothetical protein